MYMSTEITIQKMELRLTEIHMRPKGSFRHIKEQKEKKKTLRKKKELRDNQKSFVFQVYSFKYHVRLWQIDCRSILEGNHAE